MKGWKKFLAVCFDEDGGVVVIPTKRSVQHLERRKFKRICLGHNAHGIGAAAFATLNDSLIPGGRIESWIRGQIIDPLAGGEP